MELFKNLEYAEDPPVDTEDNTIYYVNEDEAEEGSAAVDCDISEKPDTDANDVAGTVATLVVVSMEVASAVFVHKNR